MRLFVALLLEPPFAAAMATMRNGLATQDRERLVRWVQAQNFHLTLKFLGQVEEARLPGLESALEAALRDLPAPMLTTGDVGGFPNVERPRIVWVGLREKGKGLGALYAAVETATVALGWPPETRTYQAHLTLGRVREGRRPMPRQLAQALSNAPPPARPPVPFPRVALMRSHTSPEGPRYEELRLWRLLVV